MKVLHVITRFIAGSGGNTLASATGMDPDRYEVWVAAMPGGPLWAEARAAGVRTVEIPHMRETISPWDDVRACLQLVALIRRERFAVVHTHCSKAGLIGRVAARLAGTPVVVHTFHILAAHDGLSPLRRRAYLFLERRVRSFAHRYVAVAPRLAREAVEQRIAPPGRVGRGPVGGRPGVDPRAGDRGDRADLGIDDHAEVVGTVGRIVAQKAPLDFVRMCARVKRVRPDVVFVMVGDTTLESSGLEEETRLEADRLGVRILFTGFRADAPRVAATFDVYVVPSRYEGLGRALTEAMASGRPVVASAVNGVPDLVEPGVTGLLAAPATSTRWPSLRLAAGPPRGGRDDGGAGARPRPLPLRHRDDVPGSRRAVRRAARTPGGTGRTGHHRGRADGPGPPYGVVGIRRMLTRSRPGAT